MKEELKLLFSAKTLKPPGWINTLFFLVELMKHHYLPKMKWTWKGFNHEQLSVTPGFWYHGLPSIAWISTVMEWNMNHTTLSKSVRLSWCKLNWEINGLGVGEDAKSSKTRQSFCVFGDSVFLWKSHKQLPLLLPEQHHNSHITFLGLLCLASYFPTRAQRGRPAPHTAPYPEHSLRAEPSCSTGSALPSDTGLLLTTAVSSSSSSILHSR